MKQSEDVRRYYNNFAEKVLLNDFAVYNIRQAEIIKLCRKIIFSGANILEVGCGVGIVTKSLLKLFPNKILSLDLSEKNIFIAKKYVNSKKVEFRSCDILANTNCLPKDEKYDIILLADVLEHIPLKRQKELISSLQNVLNADGNLILTFPSPEYQQYLEEHNPAALQVIDEKIEANHLLSIINMKLVYYSYKDVWNRYQYIHAVFKSEIDFTDEIIKTNISNKIIRKFYRYYWRLKNYRFLRNIKNVL
jgi:2-polyprenyl-3-methyl-5-hydroxy-6-metoxy-1,4-benzoquinol methylase